MIKLCRPRRPEHRTRRDRNERLHQGFRKQMKVLVDAYMDWSYRNRDAGHEDGLAPDPRNISSQGESSVVLFDVFGKFPSKLLEMIEVIDIRSACRSVTYAMLATDKGIAAALVRQGMIPCAPFAPVYAISIRTLDIFKSLRCRCPYLTVQPFVKGIMDMLGVSTFHRASFSSLTIMTDSISRFLFYPFLSRFRPLP
jgi:hypothetical protein